MSRRTSKPLSPIVLITMLFVILVVYVKQQTPPLPKIDEATSLTLTTDIKPSLSTTIYRVFDMNTGKVLLSSGGDTVVPIASVTKLFAAATVLSGYDLQATTSITWSDLTGEGKAGKLSYGQTFSYRDVLFPLLIESSNDAALVLERVTEGALVDAMNTWAHTTGTTQTKFIDASGINEENVSTATDLQLLLRNAFTTHQHILDITTLPQYIGAYTGWLNNNPVAKEVGYRGGKHGYTPAANRTLVAVFDETIDAHAYTLGYIILGSDNIKADFDILRQFINTQAVKP